MRDFLSTLLLLAFGLGVLIAFVILIRVCWNDARRRGKSPFLVCVIVFCFFPLGLIAWLLFRPEPDNTLAGRQEFRLKDHRLQ